MLIIILVVYNNILIREADAKLLLLLLRCTHECRKAEYRALQSAQNY